MVVCVHLVLSHGLVLGLEPALNPILVLLEMVNLALHHIEHVGIILKLL